MNKKNCLIVSVIASLFFLILACHKNDYSFVDANSEAKTNFNTLSSSILPFSQSTSHFLSDGFNEKSSSFSSACSKTNYCDYVDGQIHFSVINTINHKLESFGCLFDESKEINCVLRLANNYSSNENSTPLIMLCHGWKGTVTNDMWYGNSEESEDLIDFFCSNGFNVFDVNSTDGIEKSDYPDFGCLELINSYLNAYDYIISNYNISDCDLFSYSMSFGTFSCLNIIQFVPGFIKASILTGPRSSYEKMWEIKDTFRKSISEKFNFDDKTGNSYEYEKIEKFDLYKRIQNDSKMVFDMPPSIWMFGDSKLDNFTDECTNTITKYLIDNCYSVECLRVDNFDHTNICYMQNLELREKCVSFFRGNLKDTSLDCLFY